MGTLAASEFTLHRYGEAVVLADFNLDVKLNPGYRSNRSREFS